MIITCPHCETQFSLDETLLGPDGRKVKCSTCEEVWFEKPVGADNADTTPLDNLPTEDQEDEELKDEELKDKDTAENQENTEDESEADDVESTKDTAPEQQEEPKPEKIKKEKIKKDPHPKSDLFGYAAAALVFAGLLTALIIFRTGIINAYPSTIGIYTPLGLTHTIETDELIFDNVKVKLDEHGAVNLFGNIVNLTENQVSIPHVRASLLDKENKLVKVTYLKLDANHLAGETDVQFMHTFEHIDEKADKVQLTFALHKSSMKTLDKPKEDKSDKHAPEKTHKDDAHKSKSSSNDDTHH